MHSFDFTPIPIDSMDHQYGFFTQGRLTFKDGVISRDPPLKKLARLTDHLG